MTDYEKDRAELLKQLEHMRSTYALGYDISNAVRMLIQEIKAEEEVDR